MKGFRFKVEGYLANFRGSTSVTNQLSFHIPPKSAVLGMIAAMSGIIKPQTQYLPLRDLTFNGNKLFHETYDIKIGIKVTSNIQKTYDYVVFESGRKSGKNLRRMPTRIEWIVNPSYEFLVVTKDENWLEIFNQALEMEFFKVYLGNANAPASVTSKKLLEIDYIKPPEKIITEWTLPRDYIQTIYNDGTGRFITEKIYGQWFIIPIKSTISIESTKNLEEKQHWLKIENEYIPVF